MQVKIQFGAFKGKILKYDAKHEARPSLARSRDVLFNWLFRCDNYRCLDLFAGTGILGLEALSLGAQSVDFVDIKKNHILALKNSIVAIKASTHCKLFCFDAITWLNTNTKIFDLIFLDPPFREGWLDKILSLDAFKQCIHSETLIYLEAERGWTPPENWNINKQKHLANVSIYLVSPKPNKYDDDSIN
jgi:16S rRNA (guanine966-N2)-methyltransferase